MQYSTVSIVIPLFPPLHTAIFLVAFIVFRFHCFISVFRMISEFFSSSSYWLGYKLRICRECNGFSGLDLWKSMCAHALCENAMCFHSTCIAVGIEYFILFQNAFNREQIKCLRWSSTWKCCSSLSLCLSNPKYIHFVSFHIFS